MPTSVLPRAALDSVRQEIGGTLGAALGVDFEESVIEAGGAYELTKWGSNMAIDILAGARYWHQDMSINLALTGGLVFGGLDLSKGIAIARGGRVDWVDPLAGLGSANNWLPVSS